MNSASCFAPDEQLVRAGVHFLRRFGDFRSRTSRLLAPVLEAFLVRDAKKPAAKFGVLAQAADVPRGGDERLLHEVKRDLFIAHQLKNINIERQLEPPEERVPRPRVPRRGRALRAVVRFGHFQHVPTEE